MDLADTCRHKDLGPVCADLGLSVPPVVAPGAGEQTSGPTKRERLVQAIAQIEPDQYPAVLERFLDRGLAPEQRNQAQDLLWERRPGPEITERVRREIADALERNTPIWEDFEGFMAMLRQLWVLESELALWTGSSLASEIERHMVRNDDWTVLDLFKQLGALTSSDRRFMLFIEGVLSGAVNPNERRQRALAEAITPPLARDGLKVIETGSTGGYPDFSIVPRGLRARPPQLILFASRATKPDLRLREVLDQEIEIVESTSDVLRYDRPIPEEGLMWDDLQAWWAEREQLSLEEAKGSLWQRLRCALPVNSPPQQALFEEYHRICGQRQHEHGKKLPALLPEVWLHWDPVAKSARGDEVMLTQRLDFLMLPSAHRRIVLEVDGDRHYSKHGRPSPAVYAETVRGDRDLRLQGYEVYRFSGHELMSGRAEGTVAEFFGRLLGSAQ
ncbi:AbiJ-related protein [Nocardiopsis suaedae]|uniref:AbiJ-NTD3 domain-containing protein n=1 Tax=Nocardiopsis suaedae TaxID=3018444 RepID=A0ABT4TR21_9ACTN|nr:hypothetical protein [Nocardiopsis suaedae]MDA2807146.1 hypothetical protein [Nocardiopsis suaedae]